LGNERHSKPVRTEPLPELTEAQKAQQEAINTLLQYDRMKELITDSLSSDKPFRLRPHIILELNGIAVKRIEDEAGRWRDKEMEITYSRHVPPPWIDVPKHIDELCEYVNDNWDNQSALHLAAYVMWRLNWIHPFIDGNGRTTRAISYYVLCSKLGFHVPGVTTIPELIAQDKGSYYKALEAADEALGSDRIDVSRMETLLRDLLANQVIAHAESASVRPSAPRLHEPRPRRQAMQSPLTQQARLGAGFGAFAVLFFALLAILAALDHQIPKDGRWPAIIVLALPGALSSGFFGGNASARGSLPITVAGNTQHPVRFSLTGGAAVLIILLILGTRLFL
jgi:hypothetical protein